MENKLNKSSRIFVKKVQNPNRYGVLEEFNNNPILIHEKPNKYISDNDLTIKSYDSYANHYSNTLALWRNEFNKKWDEIKNQGFDLTFKRMWEFYLCYCEAGFKSNNIDLIQFSIQNK